MAENRFNLVQKIVKAGIIGGLSLLPVISNGQKVKEDINWTKVKEPYGKYTLTIRSTNSLPELSKYQTNRKEPYLPYGNLNLPYEYNYKLPQDSIKGNVSKYLKKIDVCPDCTKAKRTGSSNKGKGKQGKNPPKPTSTKPITPQETTVVPVNKTPEKKTEEPYVPKTSENGKPSMIYNVNETNITNNTTNNYYGDTTKTKQEQQKLSSLELRTLIEGSKTVNPLNSHFWEASGAIELGNGSVWGGVYGRLGFGKKVKYSSIPVDNEFLLNQAINLSTKTEGTRNSNMTTSYPMELGAQLSLDSKSGLLRVDFFGGTIEELTELSNITEKGYDWISQNGEVVGEKKPYEIEIAKGKSIKKYLPTAGFSAEVHPGKGRHLYFGGRVQYVGEGNSKPAHISVNATTGCKFGGGKKSK